MGSRHMGRILLRESRGRKEKFKKRGKTKGPGGRSSYFRNPDTTGNTVERLLLQGQGSI